MADNFLITLDSVEYRAKPSNMAAITSRLQRAGATACNAEAFCEHVKRGRAWVGATYAPSPRGWGDFQQQRIFAVDIDNKQGDKQLTEKDEGFLSFMDAIDRCQRLKLAPLCLYFTLSARCPDVERYRIVFDMGESLDEEQAREVTAWLLTAFPEADQACKNPNRIWLGSNGEVIETWKDRLYFRE